VDHHVKQRISRRFGRRPRKASRAFEYKVLCASTSPIQISYDYDRFYRNLEAGFIYEETDTIQFSRSICNKPMLQRMQAVIQDSHATHAGSWGTSSYPMPFLIEHASCVTTIRNTSSTHVTVLVYEVVPREHVPQFRLSAQTVDFDEYDDAENTQQLFRTRFARTEIPYMPGNNFGQYPISTSATGAAAPVNVPNVSEAYVVPVNQKLPLSYSPFDCPHLVAYYKFSKAKTITLAPDGQCVVRLSRNVPKRWNPELTNGFQDFNPYDFRNLTRAHFIRVLPEKHPASEVTLGTPVPLRLDPITVAVSSSFKFQVRAPFENRPIKAKGEVGMVGEGHANGPDGTIFPTSAILHTHNQGPVVIPTAP